ncbi:MAG: hypothetical protein MHMPM18_001384 [Marteilia pararefringens]
MQHSSGLKQLIAPRVKGKLFDELVGWATLILQNLRQSFQVPWMANNDTLQNSEDCMGTLRIFSALLNSGDTGVLTCNYFDYFLKCLLRTPLKKVADKWRWHTTYLKFNFASLSEGSRAVCSRDVLSIYLKEVEILLILFDYFHWFAERLVFICCSFAISLIPSDHRTDSEL